MADSGSIRYNYTKKVWEYSNDRATYYQFAAAGHRHVSAEITDATASAVNNAIVRRGPGAEASFGRLNVDTAIYAGTYVKMGRSNAIIDPTLTTTTNFTITGSTSNLKINIQDGGGNVNFLWNATASYEGRYLVGNEGSARMLHSSNENGIVWGLYGAAKGSAGQDITWTRELYLANHTFTFGPSTDPYGTINSGGNVSMRGTFYGKGFETTSERKFKQNIEETKKDALGILNALTIFEYTYIDDPENTPRIGLMADDVDDKYLTGPEGDHFSISNTVGYLVKAVQQLTDRIEAIEAKL